MFDFEIPLDWLKEAEQCGPLITVLDSNSESHKQEENYCKVRYSVSFSDNGYIAMTLDRVDFLLFNIQGYQNEDIRDCRG
jgi:hypothetical protein